MILVDSNVFMYAAGADHPNKESSVRFLEQVASGEQDAVIDAEVLQEILHRYRAIGRWQDGRRVYDLARRIVPVVVPITARETDAARLLLDQYPSLKARDALHAAVVLEVDSGTICSYDGDFDTIRGLKRLEPSAFTS
jgi:predicted nucleic acid-binding protein